MKKSWREKCLCKAGFVILASGVIFLCNGLFSPTMGEAKTIHVKADAMGANTGASWANAFKYLQDGLAAAVAGDEIWVAAGSYKPDQGAGKTPGDRDATFTLKPDVGIYGGFAGNETALVQRNFRINTTILSGDLKGDDRPDFVNFDDNSYHVVTFHGAAPPHPTAVLDGITVARGNANNMHYSQDRYMGAGLYFKSVSPVIRNCIVRDNYAYYGGGVEIVLGTLTLTNSVIKNNVAFMNGGGIDLGGSDAVITNSVIANNHANSGGGLFIQDANPLVTHCVIINNFATYGNGMYISSSDPTILNSILWGSPAGQGPVRIYEGSAAQDISNPKFLYSNIQGGLGALANAYGKTTYTGNIDADPLLTADGHLRAGSPCLNAGDPASVMSLDVDGEARPSGSRVDMGIDEFIDTDADGLADFWEVMWFGNLGMDGNGDGDRDGLPHGGEYLLGTNPASPDTDGDGYTDFEEKEKGGDPLDPYVYPGRIHVNGGARGKNNGTSWTDAYIRLQDALAAAAPGCEIWVAGGVYLPDQGAGITPGDRLASFRLKPRIAVYGGFAGHETDLVQRDWVVNRTLLSGDLRGDDRPGFINYADNSYHVIRFEGYSPYASTILDGVAVGHGNAMGVTVNDNLGAGMFLKSGNTTARNCTIHDNKAGYYGGGVYSDNGALSLINCIVRNNHAGERGGGISATFTTTTITNSIIRDNNSAMLGGGLHLNSAKSLLTHCTITNNFADTGGGIYLFSAETRIVNSVLWGNRANDDAQIGMDSLGSDYQNTLVILASVFQGGVGAIPTQYGITTYINNIEIDPRLTADGHLLSGSPCIDAGDPATSISTDIDGESRPSGNGFDMGADEFIDTDNDLLPDAWELLHGLDPRDNGAVNVNNGAMGDPDNDGLINSREYLNATSPRNPDNDGDGVTATDGDCNDADPGIFPGAVENCADGIDNNCNGLVDRNDPACARAPYSYHFPAIKDDNAVGWANYLTVAAKDPVAMDVTIRVCDMTGALMGTYIYSDTIPGANAPAIAPYARVAQRPCLIASNSSLFCAMPVEGSMTVETSVPAIATTNTIANSFEGFSIVEAAKPKSMHNFPKAFDGPNGYQVYLLARNIHEMPVRVTAQLFGKTASSPGHGATGEYLIQPQATLKIRPSDIAGGIDFSGSVVLSSFRTAPGDGQGPAIPAMCRYELGKEAMTIYESTVEQPALYFPTVKDGKFGGASDYQNYLSVVNPNATTAKVEVILHANDGTRKATTGTVFITAGGKATWRPSMILGTVTAPIDFEGAVFVTSSVPVVGQTNTMYPGANIYQCDAFDLFESAIPNTTLFFPKAFDNIAADGHLYDNVVYVQNPDATAKNIKIEQFNNNGSANGVRTVPLGPNATHVYRPKDLVTDGTATFRGSVRVTETGGGKITGAIKYDLHQGTTTATPVDAMTLYRSMGL